MARATVRHPLTKPKFNSSFFQLVLNHANIVRSSQFLSPDYSIPDHSLLRMPIANAVPSRKPRAGSSRSQSRALRSLDNRSVAQPSDGTEVIVISSDSEDDAHHSPPPARKRASPDLREPSQNVRPSKARKTHKEAARSHAKSTAEICELSSDDEKDDVIVILRKRVRELEEVSRVCLLC